MLIEGKGRFVGSLLAILTILVILREEFFYTSNLKLPEVIRGTKPVFNTVASPSAEPTLAYYQHGLSLPLKSNEQSESNTTTTPPSTSLPSCSFSLSDINEACPRFVFLEIEKPSPGLGDQFMQLLVQNAFALAAKATPVSDPSHLESGEHGDYSWGAQFFNAGVLMKEKKEVLALSKNVSWIKIPRNQTSYEAALQLLEGKCHVAVQIHIKICNGSCYVHSGPQLQRFRHLWACALLQTDPNVFPRLIYDPTWYNVAIHLRVGDISLHNTEPSYFFHLQEELNDVLRGWHVHYYFISEAPHKGDGEAVFDFLPGIFRENDRAKVSFKNHMDVPTSLFHMMNADMVVSTGSSFPYIAATVSPKPVFLFGKPKEGLFLDGILRDDFVLVDGDGHFLRQHTREEIRALVALRNIEVGGRRFPHDYQLKS